METQVEYELVKPRPQTEALVEVEQQRVIAETQGAMIIAKRFPRDPIDATDKIINACTRPGLAEAALYEYARGGTAITGPSIRLAEAIAQSWQNLQFGIRELEQRNGVSTVEAFAWDVENNTRQIKVFQVAHKRKARGLYTNLEDPRDIYEMVANQGARRLRACILGIIPGDVVEAAVKQCETTLKSKAEVTPERIKSLLEKFADFKVTKEQLEKRIQRHLDAMTPAQLVNLGKIYNSLKDGMSAAADWFPQEEDKEQPKGKTETLKDKLRENQPEPEAPTPPVDFLCPHCSFHSASERGLKKHITQSHPPFDPAPDGPNQAQDASSPEAIGETTPEKSGDDFLSQAIAYKEELNDDTWASLMRYYRMTDAKGFKPIQDFPEEDRERFLKQCQIQLDKQNA